MLLAVRPLWLEKRLHSLDKMYHLHKWAGIWATVLGIMLIITLWQRFPYHVWRYTHKAISVIYLFIVFHSVVLTPTGWWAGPAGLLIVISSLIGTCCAFVALSGGIGRSRRYHGTVLRVEQHSGDILEVTCQLPRYWAHRPGQFAFITFDRFEGAHPFTINSAEEAVFSEQLLHLTAVVPSVSLRLHYSDQQGFLSVEQALKGHSNNTKMWFCGPQGFADGLQKGMQAHGCPPQNFHKEYFNVR